jgi:hypothetical protein
VIESLNVLVDNILIIYEHDCYRRKYEHVKMQQCEEDKTHQCKKVKTQQYETAKIRHI